MRCTNCLCTDTYTKEYEHTYHFKDKEVKFTTERRFCKKCNNLVYDAKLDNEAGQKAIAVYNKKYGIPKEKIIELRNKYNLSQELFSKIIGCAKKTLISYEKGTSIPNDNYIIIINSLIDKPDTIETLINANRQRFTDKEYLKIQNKVSLYLSNNIKNLLGKADFTPAEYNGYTKFNKEKLINIILLLTDKQILKTKLLKEMFYVDFLCYKKTGMGVTGLEYVKLNYGPVPDDFDKIINECNKNNYITYNIDYENEYEYHSIKTNKEANKKIFTKEELTIIEKVKDYFKNYTAKDIVDYSHKEKAFIETEYYKSISYEYAFDINNID